jgi:hypothetical protein
MSETDEITPGERRELKSVVKGQFKVLRAEVDRRKEELKGEIESDLLRQYRAQDEAIAAAQREVEDARQEFLRTIQRIGASLKETHPELTVGIGERYGSYNLQAADEQRAQQHRAMIANIPNLIGDAKLNLDRQEMDILRELSVGALKSRQAALFLAKIPTVGELVPRVRLREIENDIKSLGGDG